MYNHIELPKLGSGLAESTVDDQKNYSVQKGDVFFTRTSETIEEIGFSSTCLETIDKAVFSGFLIRFRPKRNILFGGCSKYYFSNQLLRAFFIREMNLVTRASLSQNTLNNLPVLLPPFEKQKELFVYLEQKISVLEQIISKTIQTISKLQEYKTAIISAAVTGKIKVTKDV